MGVIRGGAQDLLTVREAATRLSVKPITIYRLCERGALAYVRVSNAIRISPKELAAFVASNTNRKIQ